MKRWLPIAFLGLSLLATIVVEARYAQYLAAWTPENDYATPQPLGLFALLSLPVGLTLLWHYWKPQDQRVAALGRARRLSGDALLVASVTAWAYLIVDSVVCAWVAVTPSHDPLPWLRISSYKSTLSLLSLWIGGPIALWLKGIRMPPRNSIDMK